MAKLFTQIIVRPTYLHSGHVGYFILTTYNFSCPFFSNQSSVFQIWEQIKESEINTHREHTEAKKAARYTFFENRALKFKKERTN